MSKARRVALAFAVLVVTIVGLYVGARTMVPGFAGAGAIDFLFYSSRYEKAVERAGEVSRETSEPVNFRTEWQFDYGYGPDATNVCAARIDDGSLFVRIIAYDWHHAGMSGYVHFKGASSRREIQHALEEHGCGEWTVVKRIGESWWVLENLLG